MMTKVSKRYEPICVKCWDTQPQKGMSDYDEAREIALSQADHYFSYGENDHLRDKVFSALMASITKQALKTSGALDVPSNVSPNILYGVPYFQEALAVIHEHGSAIPSLEVARLTHVGNHQGVTDTYSEIDRLYTSYHGEKEELDEPPRYKIRSLDTAGVVLERKQNRYKYFGGAVIVTAGTSLLLDTANKQLNRDVRVQFDRVRRQCKAAGGFDNGYSRRLDEEASLCIEEQPVDPRRGALLLSTIYYAWKND